MSTNRTALAGILAGVALSAVALSEWAQTCRQVLSDVVVCSYTATNYVLLAVGAALVVAGVINAAAGRDGDDSPQ